MNPKPGEVYLVDFGLAGKKRPVVIISREDPNAPRALVAAVPLTTSKRGGQYEVDIGKPKFLHEASSVNIQGVFSVGYHELIGPLGRLDAKQMKDIKDALRWMFDL